MPTKEIAIMPGIRIRASINVEIQMPNGKTLNVSCYDSPPSALISDEDGIDAAVESVSRQIRDILNAVTFGVQGRR